MVLDRDSQNSKIYFGRQNLAPYLKIYPTEQDVDRTDAPKKEDKTPVKTRDEADVAAGGASVLERVSPFSILPRSSSSITLTGGGGTSDPRGRLPTTPASTIANAAQIDTQRQPSNETENALNITPSWRLRDRMKTVGVGLVMALNVGTDPPDITKPHPCATLQCWMDPNSTSRVRAKEKIGERLEAQYARWQQQRAARPLKYRRALDPTVEDVRTLCLGLRRQARNERILLHYNGHGVPRPTANGEIWVFDKNHTEYIPLSITDLRQWMGKPSIVVLDCSSAGILVPFLTAPIADTTSHSSIPGQASVEGGEDQKEQYMETMASSWVRDTIVLCPTSEGEWLPMHPDYPADIFTSCLTTPIKMALRWFVRKNPQSMGKLHPEAVDSIPGKENDRKTPLGELNWIFTAVTDSIAWNVLPKPLFQRLFRQDLLVASMFRNFLLGDRILRSLDCTPQSHPPLPPDVNTHPLWHAFDLAMETCLFGLMKDGILGNHVIRPLSTPSDTATGDDGADGTVEVAPPENTQTGPASSISSPFFSEQLTAFEVWLEFASIRKMYLISGTYMDPPEQLPVVLQVLLSQVHRVRALRLLREFLELGPWAVNLSLSLGIFPYVMKLLQSPEYKSLLVSIWASILAFDSSCQVDLVKDGALTHFIQHLTWGLNNSSNDGTTAEAAKERTLAAFILAVSARGYPQGQAECSRLNLAGTTGALLSSYEAGENQEVDPTQSSTNNDVVESHFPAPFRMWLCLCIANMAKGHPAAQNEAFSASIHKRLFNRMKDVSPDVRAAACCALACMLEPAANKDSASSTPVQGPSLGQTPPQFQAGGTTPEPLVPQRGMPPNMVVPPGVSSSGALPAGLQPSFTNTAGMANMQQWNPQQQSHLYGQHQQQMDMMVQQNAYVSALNIPGVHQQPPMHNSTMPQQQHGMLNHLQGMHGMPMSPSVTGPNSGSISSSSNGRPTGLANPVFGGHGDPHGMMPPGLHQIYGSMRQRKPSVYDDHSRMERDLHILEVLVEATEDGSSVVRYEATISLAVAVGKYIDAFLYVAEEKSSSRRDENENDSNRLRNPRFELDLEGIDHESLERFSRVWKQVRELQHNDPNPEISKIANDVVIFVHEHLLQRRMEQFGEQKEPSQSLSGIQEESSATQHTSENNEREPPRSDGSAHRMLQKGKSRTALRRASSDLVNPVGISDPISLDWRGRFIHQTRMERSGSQSKLECALPQSKFYEWKKSAFADSIESENEQVHSEFDPLSPMGAARAYQERRNFLMQETGQRIASHFSALSPKPPKPTKQSIEEIMAIPEENPEEDAAISSLKKDLEFKEIKVLRNSKVKMTTMLKFHAYEDILVACGSEDGVSVWDTEKGVRSVSFINGNPKGSRMTTAMWLNEASTSLFLVGCDDGSVRIWDGFVEKNGEPSRGPPNLVSAFSAAPDIVSGERGKSGLVCEWQQYSGKLIAGGNSGYLRVWDLEAEKCSSTIETNTDACVTTLTSAWDSENLGTNEPKGSPGYGPNILVGGHSDGSLKIFDIRCSQVASEQSSIKSWTKRRRPTKYTEHSSWIVNTTFTGYSGRYEVVSGSVAGDIKAWDLRMSSSLRTLGVQRSTMTALAVHAKIPVVATGSHAQFIKILTLDGETLKVVRYHEEMSSHRIGPVSCLEFHPFKPLLAAGATDTLVSLYAPKEKK